jgi:hypothetical protein
LCFNIRINNSDGCLWTLKNYSFTRGLRPRFWEPITKGINSVWYYDQALCIRRAKVIISTQVTPKCLQTFDYFRALTCGIGDNKYVVSRRYILLLYVSHYKSHFLWVGGQSTGNRAVPAPSQKQQPSVSEIRQPNCEASSEYKTKTNIFQSC